MARLAQLVDEHIDADFVDINCGGCGIGAARVASACYKLVIISMLLSCYTTAGGLFLSAATHPSSCVCIIRQHHTLFLLFSVHCWYSIFTVGSEGREPLWFNTEKAS